MIYKCFYPQSSETRDPFLSDLYPVTYKIALSNGKTIYLYDILNCADVIDLMDNDSYIFKDYVEFDQNTGEDIWEINQTLIDELISKIGDIPDTELDDAYFQMDTTAPDGTIYTEGTLLPSSIRTSTFKAILIMKIRLDAAGLAKPPKDYFECLARRNPELYDLLFDPEENLYATNRELWMNRVNAIMVAVENELSMHVKYFEQSVVGKDLFFQPLITLINHFKSFMVEVVKTGVRYIFDDKMDIGGNSNMFKLFDGLNATVHFTTIASSGYVSELGLYDTVPKTKIHIELDDKTRVYRTVIGSGFAAEESTVTQGSVQMIDEMKFYRNGKPIDDPEGSMWYTGEPGAGRWSEEDDVLMRVRTRNARIYNAPVDMEGWKNYVESYNEEDEYYYP